MDQDGVEGAAGGRTGGSGSERRTGFVRRGVAFIERAGRRILALGLMALAGGSAIWWALAVSVKGETRGATLTAWAVVLVAPPVILVALSLALRELARVPDRLANLPGRAGEHAGELGRLADETRRRARDRRPSAVLSAIRLWRRAAGSRDVLGIAAPLAVLFTPWGLAASLLAISAGLAEVLGGAVALLWLALR